MRFYFVKLDKLTSNGTRVNGQYRGLHGWEDGVKGPLSKLEARRVSLLTGAEVVPIDLIGAEKLRENITDTTATMSGADLGRNALPKGKVLKAEVILSSEPEKETDLTDEDPTEDGPTEQEKQKTAESVDQWKDVKLEDDFPYAEALARGEVTTLGDVVAHDDLTQIKGIAKKSAQKIAEATKERIEALT